MPVSSVENIAPIMIELERRQPSGVIDIGCGVGLYGALMRNYLDGRWGRVKKGDWKVHLMGVEGFPEYISPLWGAYDKVLIQDFTKMYEDIKGWPYALMIDSLEHCEKTEGKIILRSLVETNERVLISVPVGVCEQGAEFGNEFERHRTTFRGEQDFVGYDYRVLHEGGGQLVVVIKGGR
jgi:hypothetical protein